MEATSVVQNFVFPIVESSAKSVIGNTIGGFIDANDSVGGVVVDTLVNLIGDVFFDVIGDALGSYIGKWHYETIRAANEPLALASTSPFTFKTLC